MLNLPLSNQQTYLYPTLITLYLLSISSTLMANGEGQWKYTLGADYQTGDYGGTDDTDIFSIPISAKYSKGPWSGKVSASLIRIDGPDDVVGGGDSVSVIRDTQTVTDRSETGIGDIWTSVTYAVENIPPEQFYLDLTAKLKIPTADEDDGLGTGEVDYTLQADFFKSMDRYTPMATIARKFKGDPSGISLDDVWYLSAGSDYRWDDKNNIGLTLDHQEASSSGGDDALEFFGYWTLKVNRQRSITFYATLGLDDGSPDQGAGVQFTYKP